MSVVALARGRRAEAARQKDTCRITKPGVGARVLNPVTLQYTDPDPVTVYEGACRIPKRSNPGTASSSSAGEATWQVGESPLNLPLTGTDSVAVGNTVTYLTSVEDPSLAGRVFTISAPERQTEATARRFRMKETVG